MDRVAGCERGNEEEIILCTRERVRERERERESEREIILFKKAIPGKSEHRKIEKLRKFNLFKCNQNFPLHEVIFGKHETLQIGNKNMLDRLSMRTKQASLFVN